MKKLFKTLSVLAIVTLCTICMAAFAGCGDDSNSDLDPNIIYITVLDENGKAIDGTTFGEADFDETNHQVQIQFCTVDGKYGCSMNNPNVDKDGKAQFNLSEIKNFEVTNNATTVELHVLGVTKKGYKKEYKQYKISEIPQTITVTLEKADA